MSYPFRTNRWENGYRIVGPVYMMENGSGVEAHAMIKQLSSPSCGSSAAFHIVKLKRSSRTSSSTPSTLRRKLSNTSSYPSSYAREPTRPLPVPPVPAVPVPSSQFPYRRFSYVVRRLLRTGSIEMGEKEGSECLLIVKSMR